jgi:hypothetical protein
MLRRLKAFLASRRLRRQEKAKMLRMVKRAGISLTRRSERIKGWL